MRKNGPRGRDGREMRRSSESRADRDDRSRGRRGDRRREGGRGNRRENERGGRLNDRRMTGRGSRPGSDLQQRPMPKAEPLRQQRSVGPLGESCVPGRKAALQLLQSIPQRVQKVIVAKEARLPSQLQQVIEQSGKTVSTLALADFDLAYPEGHHQGIALSLLPPKNYESNDLFDLSKSGAQVLVALDQVVDPRNVGAVLRVCEAMGVDGVFLSSDRSAGLTAVARKASVGASELLPVCIVPNLHRLLLDAREREFWIVGTGQVGQEASEQATTLLDLELTEQIVIVFGSEGGGMRELTRKSCDVIVEIPMIGRIESLNVSQAVSIVLFELMRKRGRFAQK